LCVQIDIGEKRVTHGAESFVLSVVAGEVHRHECNRNVFAFDAFATVVKGGKFEFEANYSAGKFVTGISGYQGEGSCCTPRLVKCREEDDSNTSEEVLPAILTA